MQADVAEGKGKHEHGGQNLDQKWLTQGDGEANPACGKNPGKDEPRNLLGGVRVEKVQRPTEQQQASEQAKDVFPGAGCGAAINEAQRKAEDVGGPTGGPQSKAALAVLKVKVAVDRNQNKNASDEAEQGGWAHIFIVA